METIDTSAYAPSPSGEERTKRLGRLKLSPADVTAPHLQVRAGERFTFSPDNPAAAQWMRPFPDLTTIDELKQFIGVPNAVFETDGKPKTLVFEGVDATTLAPGEAMELMDQNSKAYQVASNLMYGHVPAVTLAGEGVKHLTLMMIGALKGQHMVLGGDLIVAAGAVVDLGPNPTVAFDRIIIHGDGAIIVHNHQKISAGVIQWLAN